MLWGSGGLNARPHCPPRGSAQANGAGSGVRCRRVKPRRVPMAMLPMQCEQGRQRDLPAGALRVADGGTRAETQELSPVRVPIARTSLLRAALLLPHLSRHMFSKTANGYGCGRSKLLKTHSGFIIPGWALLPPGQVVTPGYSPGSVATRNTNPSPSWRPPHPHLNRWTPKPQCS